MWTRCGHADLGGIDERTCRIDPDREVRRCDERYSFDHREDSGRTSPSGLNCGQNCGQNAGEALPEIIRKGLYDARLRVEVRGIEPLASTVRLLRSAN